jgi:hypothetical protein
MERRVYKGRNEQCTMAFKGAELYSHHICIAKRIKDNFHVAPEKYNYAINRHIRLLYRELTQTYGEVFYIRELK